MNGKQVIKILRTKGWEVERGRGSHHLLKKGSVKVPVPVHGKKDLGKGLLARIEKQTGVKLT